MDGAVISLTAKLNGLRTGRASSSLLEPIKVDVYGAAMSINQLGTVSVPEPKLITIQVWDESQVADVEKAICNSGLGLNLSSDGQVIRVPLPNLTEERRRDLAKKAAEYGESAKVAIRNVRRDAIEELKKRGKDKKLSEDELKNETEEINKTVDRYMKKVEDVIARKCAEIMKI